MKKAIRLIALAIAALGPVCAHASTYILRAPEQGLKSNAVSVAFSSCSVTGSSIPTQSQCNAAYTGTALAGAVTVNAGIQTWIVPQTGTYSVTVAGAAGGGSSYFGTKGGNGAVLTTTVNLTQGTVLKILVGQQGETNPSSGGGGGGGGTFVAIGNNTPLVVAGAGGGAQNSTPGIAGSQNTSGTNSANNATSGGTNGSGGLSGSNIGGSGAGFNGNGSGNTSTAYAFVNGGAAGVRLDNYGSYGGFGGGGGSDGAGNAGGGGGYSGGAGSGGGGGSYYNTSVAVTFSASNTSDGYVKLTKN